MTDTLLVLAGILCLCAGLAGCILPALPGPPLAYAGLVLLHLTARFQLPTRLLALGLVLVVAALVLDAVIPALGAKRWGGTRRGIGGCVFGSLIGLFFFPPLGFLVGAFAGAVAGELLGGKDRVGAFRAGVGALMGFLAGTVLKVALCGLFAFWFVSELAGG